MRQVAVKHAGSIRGSVLFVFASILALVLASIVTAVPASAQKQKKDKKQNAPSADPQVSLPPLAPPSDSQAIDQAIGEAMGYWQIGDVESMHKYYADDVVMVSGVWEPPIIGWDNFLRAYQEQRTQVTGARIDRSNTLIKVNGNTGWATYQFIYVAMMDNKVVQFRGHTTLILNKQADRWVITLNHSSVVDSSLPAQAPAAPATPANSAQPGKR